MVGQDIPSLHFHLQYPDEGFPDYPNSTVYSLTENIPETRKLNKGTTRLLGYKKHLRVMAKVKELDSRSGRE